MFIVDQKVGNHIYVYEVHSYWDKVKKAPRQQRIRIGKRDPVTGEFIEKRTHRMSREYGPIYFLANLVERLGLQEMVLQEFPDYGREIILSCCFQVAEHQPFYLCNSWLERIYLKEPCELRSQRLSRMLQDIGGQSREVHRFLDTWLEIRQENEFIVFDITSISTHSKHIDFAEWGYNRNGESLAQINFGVVYGEPSNLPLLYELYPGSIPDVTTLKNVKTRLERAHRLRTLFVLDRGFYSAKNIRELAELGQFIIPLPITTKAAKALVKTYCGGIRDAQNAFRSGTQLFYVLFDSVEIGGDTYRAYVYFNEKRSSGENERLVTFLLTVEELVGTRPWKTAAALVRRLDDELPDWKRYFKVEAGDNGFVVVRRKDAIEQAMMSHGIFILLTNSTATAEQTLSYYRRKDGVEKLFDSMKHGIDRRRLRVHSRQSMQGLLFVDFVTLILYSAIRKTLKDSGLGKRYTVLELFYELKKLSVIEIDEKRPIISELTRKQKEIFNAFEIPFPITT